MKCDRAKLGHYFYPNKKLNIMTKQATIDLLKQQLPGFYSAEQVIDMISKIEPEVLEAYEFEFNDDQIKTLVGNITDEITDLGADAIDDYELSMNGREVELDSIDISDYSIKNAVKSAVENWVEGLKEEQDN
jgi:predicted Zn-dependent protease